MSSQRGPVKESAQYGFDEFYMDVIDRLLALNKRPETERFPNERNRLDALREFLEYIEDREFYYHRTYKPDVMKYVVARIGHILSFHDVYTVFTKERKAILDVIYRKDHVYDEKRNHAPSNLLFQR